MRGIKKRLIRHNKDVQDSRESEMEGFSPTFLVVRIIKTFLY